MPITNYPASAIMLANDEGVVTASVDHEPDWAYTVAMYRSLKPGEVASIDSIPDIPVIRIDVVDVSSADPDYDRDDPDDPRAPRRYGFALTADHAARLAHRLLELADEATTEE